jgi:hypothetical protein
MLTWFLPLLGFALYYSKDLSPFDFIPILIFGPDLPGPYLRFFKSRFGRRSLDFLQRFVI